MAAVPGSVLRRVLFWAHLACGVVAGLVIIAASVTGVLLAYERQLVEAAAAGNRLAVAPATTPLSADRLAELGREALPDARRLSLVFSADPAVPVSVSRGGEGAAVLLNPYTGGQLADASAGTRHFLRSIENLHRWLGGRPGGLGSTLVDLATLLFLFITLSGLYLWLPPTWRWLLLKARCTPRATYPNGKARDYGWHIAFSIWALVPLFVIALSGVVMSYDWANKLVYAAYGEQPPQRRAAPEGGGPGVGRPPRDASDAGAGSPTARASLEALLASAREHASPWQRLTLPINARGESIDIVAELKSDARRAPRQTLTLATRDAGLLRIAQPAAAANAQSPAARARLWMRFAHTGEQYGVAGQTIAALASLVACLLAYTGIALAWRRLVVPLWKP
jgi:uncharacterized iron-regulated membrane protein